MSEKHIVQCAKKLRDLHQAIKQAYDKDTHGEAHKHACAAFNEQFDQLAFPGGLEQAFSQLKNHNSSILPIALEFLQADPYFHRSGYTKEEILHHLKKFEFTDKQKNLFYDLLDRSIHHDQDRIFRAYAKLFPYVSTQAQQTKIKDLLKNADAKLAQRLEYICHLLHSS